MMISLIAAMGLSFAAVEDVNKDAVLCVENNGDGEEMWVIIGEKFKTGKRNLRDLSLEKGKKACLRYDGTRSLTVSHYYLSDLDDLKESGERIDPWRSNGCGKVLRDGAAFYLLGSADGKKMSCESDSTRNDGAIRSLVEKAKPFRG